jgi:hypothetical protein
MSLTLYSNDLCPKCRKPTLHAVIDSHPTDRDIAVRKFYCAQCGPIKTEFLSLKPVIKPSGQGPEPN